MICYAAQNFDLKRFNFRKLREVGVRNWYMITISDRFAVLENLIGSKDIKRALEKH
jgi:hypothetical protein